MLLFLLSLLGLDVEAGLELLLLGWLLLLFELELGAAGAGLELLPLLGLLALLLGVWVLVEVVGALTFFGRSSVFPIN